MSVTAASIPPSSKSSAASSSVFSPSPSSSGYFTSSGSVFSSIYSLPAADVHMPSLLELSHELLHCIFLEIEPYDLAALSASCRTLYSYIIGNRLLCKELYLRRYDEPKTAREPEWEGELHDLLRLERILGSRQKEFKRENIGYVSQRVNGLLDTARPDHKAENRSSLNIALLTEYFKDSSNVDNFICASSLFGRVEHDNVSAAEAEDARQASAKLHCLYGVPIDGGVPTRYGFFMRRQMEFQLSPASCTRSKDKQPNTNNYARSKVYDLREYTDGSFWGPFKDDGTSNVDWEKVEAVMIVLGFNLRKFHERTDRRFHLVWANPFIGATPYSFIAPPPMAASSKQEDDAMSAFREVSASLDAQDPYGVTGTWMRVVCFLDYNDLYTFNFAEPIPDDEPRPPIETEEAIRLIKIKLQVTKITPQGGGDETEDRDGLDWSNFQGERLPVVHFKGTSRSLHANWDPNANSMIRGTVRQTPEGEIRWTTFSIFHGEERWRSEGIQIGGLKSARGVLGNWFDKDYDVHGPAGPTAFWKTSDDLEEEHMSTTPTTVGSFF